MAFSDVYRRQVELLVRTLPHVAEEDCFALKGGTAINLFYRDLPRLSVDIDLTYLPLADRKEALADIDAALKRIARHIEAAEDRVTITKSAPATQDTINKLVIRTRDRVQIKIEVSPVLRGSLYEPKLMSVSPKTEDAFGFAEMSVLSFPDLFAGKILAALDRQHPRDLFDVHQLLDNEGITDALRTAVIVYMISHDRTPQRLLRLPCRDIQHDYDNNFTGMTAEDPPLDRLIAAHEALVTQLLEGMPPAHRQFLVSFFRGEPDWALIGEEGVEDLPAVRWRQINLERAGRDTRSEIVRELEDLLGA